MQAINLSRPTLDDVFLTMTGRSLRDDSPSAAGRPQEPQHAGTRELGSSRYVVHP
jgi:hypothetical protein